MRQNQIHSVLIWLALCAGIETELNGALFPDDVLEDWNDPVGRCGIGCSKARSPA